MPLLFVYGKLKPEYEPPKSTSGYMKDSVRGDLYQNSEDAYAVNLDNTNGIINGYTMIIDEADLVKLDKEEAPEYHRTPIETNRGHHAYIYRYIYKLPKNVVKTDNYKWSK